MNQLKASFTFPWNPSGSTWSGQSCLALGFVVVDALDDVIDVSAGKDQQGHGVDRLGVYRARTVQVAAEDRSGCCGEEVGPSVGHGRELGDRFGQWCVPVRKPGSGTVQCDLEPDVGVSMSRTTRSRR